MFRSVKTIIKYFIAMNIIWGRIPKRDAPAGRVEKHVEMDPMSDAFGVANWEEASGKRDSCWQLVYYLPNDPLPKLLQEYCPRSIVPGCFEDSKTHAKWICPLNTKVSDVQAFFPDRRVFYAAHRGLEGFPVFGSSFTVFALH